VIGQTYALEPAAEAHAAIEARTAVGQSLLLDRYIAAFRCRGNDNA